MRIAQNKIWLLFIGALVVLSSCSVRKNLDKDQYLINKYKISVEGKHPEISVSELKTLLSPAPNNKIFFIRAKLWVYYKYTKKQSKFNTWLNEHFGEEPELYSKKDVISITRKMNRYLNNVGFFNSKINYSEDLYKKLANISFNIKPSEPYRVSEISYNISDSVLRKFFYEEIKNTLIKKTDIYNAYTFDDERDRITNNFRNLGYYYFNRDYIQFIIDSNFMSHSMKVNLVINNVKKQDVNNPGEFIEENHRRYFIKSVTVLPEFDPTNTTTYDTIVHNIDFWKDSNTYSYYFLYNHK